MDGKIFYYPQLSNSKAGRISSPIPVVVGGGVTLKAHIPELAKTGVDGFFVVSAIAGAAKNPREEALNRLTLERNTVNKDKSHR